PVPLLRRWLGSERLRAFGAWIGWLGYVGLLELGLVASLPAMLAVSQSRQDEPATCSILAVGLRTYLGLSILMEVAGTLLAGLSAWLIPVRAGLAWVLRLGVGLSLVLYLCVPLAVC